MQVNHGPRHAERARQIRLGVAQDQHAGADGGERDQRAHRGQVGEQVERKHRGQQGDARCR